MQRRTSVLERNVQRIMRHHDHRMNKIKREGACLRLLTCPPLAVMFGLLAWYNFTIGHVGIGWSAVVAALAFLGMLIFGAIFDRPTRQPGKSVLAECSDVEFEIFRCPDADYHADYRFTCWCEPLGTIASSCPECGALGVDTQADGRYGSTNPSQLWAPYRQLYQTRP